MVQRRHVGGIMEGGGEFVSVPEELRPDFIRTRWYEVKDASKMASIDRLSFPGDQAWDRDKMRTVMNVGAVVGRVAVHKLTGEVLGFAIISRLAKALVVVRLAVHPIYRRLGIGSWLVREIHARLSPEKRKRAISVLTEDNTSGHLFFAKAGFFCTGVEKEVGYRFVLYWHVHLFGEE